MIHAREDYNRIQDPAGKIAADEPVFLLRAKDRFAPATVQFWASCVEKHDPELAAHVKAFVLKMKAWQDAHTEKIPDSPEVGLGKK